MKKEIITITGDLASGKSTISKILCEKLGYKYYSNGLYFRNLAKEYNMDVTSFGAYVKDHPEIDIEIENNTEVFARENNRVVIDARLGFYKVPDSFKVYLKVDIDVASKRAYSDEKRKDTENHKSIEEYKNSLIKRTNLENERYLKLYNIDRTNMSNYDLVIDTTNKSIDEVVNIIITEYKKR